jgi:hypothetical protein
MQSNRPYYMWKGFFLWKFNKKIVGTKKGRLMIKPAFSKNLILVSKPPPLQKQMIYLLFPS